MDSKLHGNPFAPTAGFVGTTVDPATPAATPAPPELHDYTGELVVIITRTASMRGATQMADYMRQFVSYATVPDEAQGDSVDISVMPSLCGTPGCAVCQTSTRVLDTLRANNVREYLAGEAMKLASATQRQRMDSEVTREEEILGIARGELFKPFLEFTKRPKRWASSVVHTRDCAGPDVRWSVTNVPPEARGSLTSSQATNLYLIVQAARIAGKHEWLCRTEPDGFIDLKVQRHAGTCSACGASHVDHGVLVTIPYAGRTLSREYLL